MTHERWRELLAQATAERGGEPLRIAQFCVQELGATGAGMSVEAAVGTRGVVCATDAVAMRIEDLQVTLGEGPCVDALRTGAPVLVADLAESAEFASGRWPAFMDGASIAGVRAVFAFPLRIGAIDVGAMDLYRDRPGDLTAEQLAGALMAAGAAALALAHRQVDLLEGAPLDVEDTSAHQLQVHQATGMVQVQLGVTTEEAFLRLRARAFSTGRLLVDVANDVVERRLRFSQEDE